MNGHHVHYHPQPKFQGSMEALMTDLNGIVDCARRCFESGKTQDIEFRRRQLMGMMRLLEENENLIVEALDSDFKKPPFETRMAEIHFVLNDIRYALNHMDDWIKPQPATKNLVVCFDDVFIQYEPYGLVLIIG